MIKEYYLEAINLSKKAFALLSENKIEEYIELEKEIAKKLEDLNLWVKDNPSEVKKLMSEENYKNDVKKMVDELKNNMMKIRKFLRTKIKGIKKIVDFINQNKLVDKNL